MNRALPVASLLVALYALGVAFVREPPAPPPPPPPAAPPVSVDDVLELKKRVELLEDDSRGLWDRVSALERRGVVVADGGADPTLVLEVARLRDEVRALAQGGAGFDADGGRAMVADVVRELRAEETRKRGEERARFLQGQTEKVAAFLDGAGLRADQRSLMDERLKTEAEARQAVFEGRPDAVREWMAAQRQTDKTARATLSGPQYEQFVSLRRPPGR